ncbi:MAG: HypC/HybG/HupF family hydrogenase formation chaperone [Sedimentisphaerales bacterium]|nr:HypC/HybG/HupF family hydrogenase formation chaperone [Sedimentisphaerales bacterium]
MCLAVPARIIELKGDEAIADCMGNRIETKTTLIPHVKLGDIILIHAGFAITILDEEEAKKTWQLLADLENFSRNDNTDSG